MSDNQSLISHKRFEPSNMVFTADAVRAEMQDHVRSVTALAPDDGRKASIRFAASVLRLPFERVRSLFYAQARRIEAHEADQIRAYVYAAQKLIQARAEYEQSRKEFVAAASTNMARLAPPALVAVDGETVPALAPAAPIRGRP